MTESNLDKLLPPIGSVPPAERMLRANWLGAVERSPSGKPLLWPEFVARQGRSVHIVDVREPEELVGPLGHIPGSEWVPPDRVPSLVERLGKDAVVVLVSRAGERSAPLAAKLEELGMPFVGSMVGGTSRGAISGSPRRATPRSSRAAIRSAPPSRRGRRGRAR